MSENSFARLGLPEKSVAALRERGIKEAFPIQTMAIPPAMDGLDVCGKAPTGSGKTLAFGLPMAHRISRARSKHPRGLILTPTRELAEQIRKELEMLLKPQKRTVASFYGGVSFGPQLRALRQGVDVAVACPGRLSDLVRRGAMILDEVEIVVIDEADRMADMGFLPDVRQILDQVRPDRQTMLFSATLDGDIGVLVRNYQNNPVTCEVEADESHMERTTHEFVHTRHDERISKAIDLIEKHGSTVVFCRTKRGADRVADQMRKQGVSAVPIHGGRSQGQRDRALASFTNQKSQALVATDVAARGIHVNNVECVLHFDPAGDHKDYVHRSGRTGRAGATGVVVSFVTDADVGKIRALQRELGMPLHKSPNGSTGDDRGSGGGRPPRRRRSNGGGYKGSGNGSGGGRSGQGNRSGQRRHKSNGERGGQGGQGGQGQSYSQRRGQGSSGGRSASAR